jgi:hypothetical protein
MAGKSIVTLAAHLVVCPLCEMHACVVLPDGRKTRHFGSREIGQSIIKLLTEGGCIDDKEAVFLNDQLETVQFLRKEGFPDEDVFSLEEVFRAERPDWFDENHDEPSQQYFM